MAKGTNVITHVMHYCSREHQAEAENLIFQHNEKIREK
jgi:hypothetical protein